MFLYVFCNKVGCRGWLLLLALSQLVAAAGISSHIYESAGNDKVCILHLTLYTYSIFYAHCTCAKNSCHISRSR